MQKSQKYWYGIDSAVSRSAAVEQRGIKVRIIVLSQSGNVNGNSSTLTKNSTSKKFIEGKIMLWSSKNSLTANKLMMLIADAQSSLVVVDITKMTTQKVLLQT